MAIHVNSEGAIAPVTMPMPGTPAGAAAVGSAPELLSGVACLVEARGISFQALFDGYDADGDARLSRRELAALVSDVMGPAGLRGLRYFQVCAARLPAKGKANCAAIASQQRVALACGIWLLSLVHGNARGSAHAFIHAMLRA